MQKYSDGELQKLQAEGLLAERRHGAAAAGNYRAELPTLKQAITRLARDTLLRRGQAPDLIERLLPPPAPPPARRGMPTTGAVNIFALLIDFSDHEHELTREHIDKQLFGSPTNGFPYESLVHYYDRASYGKLMLSGTTFAWHRATISRAKVKTTDEGREALIREALNQLEDNGEDFTVYDADGDGVIDYFLVFWSGPTTGWRTFWWGQTCRFSDHTFKIGGCRLGKYSWQPEEKEVGKGFNVRTPIHETGHALGLPDLYDYEEDEGPKGGVGNIDMMDNSRYDFNCFSKWLLGWLEPVVVSSGSQTLTLSSSSDTDASSCVAIWPGLEQGDIFSEMFMVELRRRTQNDKHFPAAGLLVWHIDARLDEAGEGFAYDNSYTSHKLVRLMEADGREHIEAGGDADTADSYKVGTTIAAWTWPSSAWYSGKPSGVVVAPRKLNSSGDGIELRVRVEDLDKYVDGRVFDWRYYLERYPDLPEHGVNTRAEAERHWMSYGLREGRQGHLHFQVREYLSMYGDLEAAFGDDRGLAIEHYLLHGLQEGRVGVFALDGRVFDWQFYLNRYEDLRAHGVTGEAAAQLHWLTYGVKEGRQGHASFQASQYLALYSDLRANLGDDPWRAIEHYQTNGLAEGRVGVFALDPGVFDWSFYLQIHPDLPANGIDNEASARTHWLTFGIKEGRRASASFLAKRYLSLYQDLQTVFGGDLEASIRHYVEFGIGEGRGDALNTNVFDWQFYLGRYPDLPANGVSDETGAVGHWLRFGVREGRQGHREFDPRQYLAMYSDLRSAFGEDYGAAIEHYCTFGIAEGRAGVWPLEGRIFDWQYYLQRYEDLRQHGIRTAAGARTHWLTYGVDEGRVASTTFNSPWYLAHNVDVRAAVGARNYLGAIQHWLLHGIAEHRPGAPA